MKFKFGDMVKVVAKDSNYTGAKAVVIWQDTVDGVPCVLLRDEMDDMYQFKPTELKLVKRRTR